MGWTFDGVLANFSGKFVELANRRYGTSFIELDQHDWDFKPWFTKAQVDEVWDRDIKPSLNFWEGLRVLPGTSLLQYVPNRDKEGLYVELVFITSRVPTLGRTAREQTCTWLRKHFYITFPNVIVVDHPSEKIPLCKNLGIQAAIDDKVETVISLNEAGIRTYCKLAPYNCQKPFPEGIVLVETLNSFLEQELRYES